MNRDLLISLLRSEYDTDPDFPWQDDSISAVFRHASNRKWFALLTAVPRDRLGLTGDGSVDIVNLKCSPLLADSIRQSAGVLPAWHMNRTHWVTVLLDGTASDETLLFLLEQSYQLTAPKRKSSPQREPKN